MKRAPAPEATTRDQSLPGAAATAAPHFLVVRIADVRESDQNTRKNFDKAKLAELTTSVKAKGILTPLLVRPRGAHFEIAAGHRRLRAAKAAGLAEIPVLVRDMTDVEFLEVLTIENLQREDLHPLEEAEGYQGLLERGGYDVPAIATKVGKSTSYVYQRVKLVDLVPEAKAAFLKGTFEAGHAILLARLEAPQQKQALAWARQRFLGGRDFASVRALGDYIQRDVLLDLARAPFPIDDAELVPAAGACGPCPKRTGNQSELFADVKKGDACTSPACYKAKVAALVERKAEAVAGKTGAPAVRISTEYARSADRIPKGVVAMDYRPGKGYRLVTGNGCAHAEPAVVAHGGGRHDETKLGAVVSICRKAGCNAGEPRSSASSSGRAYAAQRKREQVRRTRETAVAAAVRAAVLPKVKWPLERPVLELVARHLWSEGYAERDAVAARRGWVKPQKTAARFAPYRALRGVLDKHLPKLDRRALAELLVELVISGPDAVNPRGTGGGRSTSSLIVAAAKHFRVNAAAVRRTLEAAWRKADAAKKKSTPKKKAKARARDKRRKVQTSAKRKAA